MHMGKIEAAEEVRFFPPEKAPKPEPKARGGVFLGIVFLIVAIPYWGLRLLGSALWTDLRRLGRAVAAVGQAYGEALKRR